MSLPAGSRLTHRLSSGEVSVLNTSQGARGPVLPGSAVTTQNGSPEWYPAELQRETI